MNTNFALTWTDVPEYYLPCDFETLHPLKESHANEANFLQKSKKISKGKSTHENKAPRSSTRKDRTCWKAEEDAQLIELYNIYGPKWAEIASIMKSRTRKQIRDRYLNSLRPDIDNSRWTQEEEDQLLSLREQYGNKWCKIAAELGRSENQVKNKYYFTFHRPGACRDVKSVASERSNQSETTLASPETQFTVETVFLSLSEDELALQQFNNTQFKDSFNEINFDFDDRRFHEVNFRFEITDCPQ